MKTVIFFFLFFFTLSCSFAQLFSSTKADTLRGFLSKERACFDVTYYELSIFVDLTKKAIAGANVIHFNVVDSTSCLQLDLSKKLHITKVEDSKGRELVSSVLENSFFVYFDKPLLPKTTSNIKVYYEGEPTVAVDPPWEGGFIWTADSLGRPWVGVACEGIGASTWWPCKDHPSDEPDSMRMTFEVDSSLRGISNGKFIGVTTTNSKTKKYEWHVSYPINIYNITLNIGHYVHFSDTLVRQDGSSLPLNYYVLSYHQKKAEKHFQQVKPILFGYENIFGNYPFSRDGYALVESSYLGMEHQSGIAYGNKYRNNILGLDYIIVHESGHEWWGNNVSASDHGDLWIHESFTTYGEMLLLELIYSQKVAQTYLNDQRKKIKNNEPIQGPYHVNYHYCNDSDMYFKGAWMLHTLRNSIHNDEQWFALLKAIQEKFSLKQISSEQLVSFISEYVKQNYRPFFDHYLTTTSLPILEYELKYLKGKKAILTYRWKSVAKNFYLPIVVCPNSAEVVKIYPTSEFQLLELLVKKNKRTVIFNPELFYIDFDQLKLN